MTTAVIIGRFQPIHNGHMGIFTHAFANYDKVLVLVGSSSEARTPKNPFTFEERYEMINGLYGANDDKLKIVPLYDCYDNDQAWASQVRQLIRIHSSGEATILGANKDDSSYYLKYFKDVELYEIKEKINATDIRKMLFEFDSTQSVDNFNRYLSPYIRNLCFRYLHSSVVEDYLYYEKYKAPYENLPHPPVFVTADVFYIGAATNSKILLVKRKQTPGKDLLALPGGFVEYNETIKNAAMREFKEETGQELNEYHLKGPYIYDSPNRSLRGRVITNVFIYTYGNYVSFTSANTTDETEVVEIYTEDLHLYREYMFEDHWHIINDLIKKMKEK